MYKKFIFGKVEVTNQPLSPVEALAIIEKGSAVRNDAVSMNDILDIFRDVSKKWADPKYPRRVEAFGKVLKNTGLSKELIEAVFEKLPEMFSPENLKKKIEGELGDANIMDEPIEQGSTGARLIAQPAGLVLHVASGNVFLACIESLIDGIITKNVNFVKMSSAERDFPIIFAESIAECDRKNVLMKRLAIFWWEAGAESVENIFKQEMNRITFWGGYDALASWKKGLGVKAILVQHGPKVSFGVISNEGLIASDIKDVCERIAFDVSIWEQKACNCPQMIFVEEKVSDARMKEFLGALETAFKNINSTIPSANRSNDEFVEVLKARELAKYKACAANERVTVMGPDNLDWTIICDMDMRNKDFELSPLNRTLLIKRYRSPDDLIQSVKEQAFYLQTVGYALGEKEISGYAMALSRAGATRLCPFGIMVIPKPGTPHDGSYALRDLTRMMSVETLANGET